MIEIGGYVLDADAFATEECYRLMSMPAPEKRACWYCRNWVAGRDSLIPTEVRSLLSELGVPANGEIEVWEVPGDELPHGYGGWYMCIGRIHDAPPQDAREFMLGNWRMSFSPKASYSVAEFANREVFEIHFFTWASNYIEGDPNAA